MYNFWPVYEIRPLIYLTHACTPYTSQPYMSIYCWKTIQHKQEWIIVIIKTIIIIIMTTTTMNPSMERTSTLIITYIRHTIHFSFLSLSLSHTHTHTYTHTLSVHAHSHAQTHSNTSKCMHTFKYMQKFNGLISVGIMVVWLFVNVRYPVITQHFLSVCLIIYFSNMLKGDNC